MLHWNFLSLNNRPHSQKLQKNHSPISFGQPIILHNSLNFLTILKAKHGYTNCFYSLLHFILSYFILIMITLMISVQCLFCIYCLEQQMAAWLCDKILYSSSRRVLLSASLSSQSQSQTMMSSLFSKAYVSNCGTVKHTFFTSTAYS